MNRYFLTYLISLVMFGSNGIFASYIHMPSYAIVFFRSALGGLALCIAFLGARKKLTALQYREDIPFLILSGIALSSNWLFLFEAYAQIGVGLGSIMNYCGPALVVLVSPFVLHERLTIPKLISLAAALGGAVCISGQAVAGGITIWGIICGMMAAVAFACIIIFNRFIRHVEGMESAMIQLVISAIICGAFLCWKDGFAISLTSSDIFPLLFLGLVNTGLSYLFYLPAVQHLSVQTVTVCGYLEPLAAVFFSLIILGESLTPVQWLGAALIIGGAVWCEWQKRHH